MNQEMKKFNVVHISVNLKEICYFIFSAFALIWRLMWKANTMMKEETQNGAKACQKACLLWMRPEFSNYLLRSLLEKVSFQCCNFSTVFNYAL